MSLTEYHHKRNFRKTKEPSAKKSSTGNHIFVVQKHYASHLHYDFRLELDGVLKSWAVPKGPSTDPHQKRLAVEVEDHPVSYATFEGTIPQGEYGAGEVEIWDHGTWKTSKDPQAQLAKGHLEFELKGAKLSGKWMLIRTKQIAKKANWLLIKRTEMASVTKIPKFIEPQLCTLVTSAPENSEWIHEIKFDGYRTLARMENKSVILQTRNGLDWTKKYQSIEKDCLKLKAKSYIIDGEVVWLDKNGVTHFSQLQRSLENNSSDELRYYVFDLLFLDGKDLREMPLLQRKQLLKKLIKNSKTAHILLSEYQTASGSKVFKSACHLGLEGIISKRSDAPYSSGRGSSWVKTKCTNVQEFVICGYTVQENGSSLAALILGEYDINRNLHYVGLVGTGFNQNNLPLLMKKIKKAHSKNSPFSEKAPQSKNIIWTKPILVAQIQFGAWTEDHILRHAAFKGMREDKPAHEVVTHPEKIIFPQQKISKMDLVNYYQKVEQWILPHIKNRPLALLRCPEGQGQACFFQKHLEKNKLMITVQNLSDLLNLVQLNTLELHAWNCHMNSIDNPDKIVFDLDPDPSVNWKQVKQAAFDLNSLLNKLNLKSFINVSGNKGVHIHVPIDNRYSWSDVKNFAKSVCAKMVEQNPTTLTVNILKKNRKNKIFLDYLRNGRGATAIVPFSVRNTPQASIAMPISWTDLKTLKAPNEFTVKNFSKNWNPKKDPWKKYFSITQRIEILDSVRDLP